MPDTDLTLRFSGYIHADGVFYDQSSVDELNPSTREPLNNTRFLVRRAILRADLQHRVLSGALELEANTFRGAQIRATVMEASARWEDEEAHARIMATMGLFAIPFGYEVQQRPLNRMFLEPANMSRALFPGYYDLGGRVQGSWRFIRVQLAAMNGNPLGSGALAARDPNKSKDFLGRIGIDAAVAKSIRLEAGVSGLAGTGFHPGTPSTKDVLVWRDVNEDGIVQLSEIQAQAGTAATPSKTFSRSAIGADLRMKAELPWLGALFVFGELMWAVNLDRAFLPADPVAVGRDLRERGFAVGFVQELGEIFAAGARYDRYNPDADASDQLGDRLVPKDSTFSTLALMVAAEYRPYGRLILEYDHNDNALGRDMSGAPARLANDQLTLRAQVGF